ncbi:MAG: MFS transporter [Polyangiaceae bacterium]
MKGSDSSGVEEPAQGVVRSDIPARLDALPWTRWHRRVVVALGITWILDGLEASLIANLAPTLEDERTLGLGAAQVGFTNTVYLVGQVFGALVFGRLTDLYGRKRLFLVTLGLYLGATALSGLAPTFGVFLALRFLAGAGIGGEYSAINSAIDELVPARLRGRIDLAINGSYWIGVMLGAGLTLVLLDRRWLPVEVGWRLVFGLGAVLGLVILLVRRDVPERPRWLLLRGRRREAEVIMCAIEMHVDTPRASMVAVAEHRVIEITVTRAASAAHIARTLLLRFPRRTVLGLALMIAQAFFYNAIFFSYGLILTHFHGVSADRTGLYVLPFAAGNFLGPVVLGPLFDRWGRRVMIPLTYAVSGSLLLVTGGLFLAGRLDAVSQTVAWSCVFFVASAAASSAYLTVSELFPVEMRGMVIALFYAVATSGGAVAPLVFGEIVQSGNAVRLFVGYAFASGLMFVAAVIARVYGVSAERRSLEALAEDSGP